MKSTLGMFTVACLFIAATILIAQTAAPEPSLKQVFAGKFLVGAALNESQFSERNAADAALVKKHFNTITAENATKWGPIHPELGKYNFGPADRFVEFGEQNGMFIVGHTLVWHSQTPRWVFEDKPGQPASREVLLERMRDHIRTVVGRYKGRVRGWDVINEALDEDGSLRQSPWLKIIGEDYLVKAFEFAHEADPAAELYYNDYSIENDAKLKGAVALLKKLKAAGAHVTGVGIQAHADMTFPSVQEEETAISQFGQLGLKVMITELDIDVLPRAQRQNTADVGVRVAESPELNPYRDGLPAAMQEALARRYADLFKVFVKHSDVVKRVTFWGVTDASSWKNNWPVRGRTNYPLLFDRAGKPKPAFSSVIATAAGK